MKKFTGKKINVENGKVYTGTVIAKNEEEAKKELLEQINPKHRKNYDVIILTTEPLKMKSRLEQFVERYGFMPQYGDFEATGWMDEK